MSAIDDSLFQHIDQLNEQAWQHRVGDPHKLMVYCTEALHLAEQANYAKGKAEALRTTGFYHLRKAEHEQAISCITQALSIFQKIGHLAGEGHVYQYFGIIKRSLGEYEASMDYLFKALHIQQQENFQDGESLTYYHIGVSYKYLGSLEQALEYQLKALQLSREIDFPLTESYALHQLGVIYTDMGDFESALEYYGQSLQMRRKLGDKWGEAGGLDNMGLVYCKINEFEKALDACSKSLLLSQTINDKKGEGNALYHLGLIHHKMGKSEQAYTYLNWSLELRRELADKRGQIESLLLCIELFINQDPEATEILLREASEIGQEIQAQDLLMEIHHQQYKFYKQKREIEQALFHLEMQQQIERAWQSETVLKKLISQKVNHQVEQAKKEAENLVLKAEMKLLADRQRIARDLHDDVGSTLSSISILSESYVRDGQTVIDPARFGNLGDKARAALESISDIVWMVNPENDSMEHILTRMTSYAVEILESINITLIMDIDPLITHLNLPMERRKDFYLLFKEAINNIAKYSAATQVWINLHECDQEVCLEIKDNGRGFDLDQAKKGNGLLNMQQRAQRLQGNFSLQSKENAGTAITLTFPFT